MSLFVVFVSLEDLDVRYFHHNFETIFVRQTTHILAPPLNVGAKIVELYSRFFRRRVF